MRIALIPLKTKPRHPKKNYHHLETVLASIANAQPDLIVLPECTLTGYLYAENDLARFAEPIPGETLAAFARLARQYRAHICFGMLERAGTQVYDSGVLLDREGRMISVQRKMSEQPPFQNGTQVEAAETELGKVAMLLCGDLFHAEAIAQLPDDLDLVLVPMARAFAGKSPDRQRWETEERAEYLQAVKTVGKTALLVNALDDGIEEPSFGGALVVDGDGKILAEAPHGSDDVLLYEL
jgi:N-carbamoylputrescine amidase